MTSPIPHTTPLVNAVQPAVAQVAAGFQHATHAPVKEEIDTAIKTVKETAASMVSRHSADELPKFPECPDLLDTERERFGWRLPLCGVHRLVH